jgi:hypothetical protein
MLRILIGVVGGSFFPGPVSSLGACHSCILPASMQAQLLWQEGCGELMGSSPTPELGPDPNVWTWGCFGSTSPRTELFSCSEVLSYLTSITHRQNTFISFSCPLWGVA